MNEKTPSKVKKQDLIQQYVQQKTDPNGKTIYHCIIDPTIACPYSQSIYRSQNFVRHFQKLHPEKSQEKGLNAKISENENEPEITIPMSKEKLVSSILQLVTVHSLPFAAVEWKAIKNLTEAPLKCYNLHINRHNVVDLIKKSSEKIVDIIGTELDNKQISLKLDVVSKMYRSFLGVNVQIIDEKGKFVKRNLGIIELQKQHTAENLGDELTGLLTMYDLLHGQISSMTVDNAPNILKMTRLASDSAEEQFQVTMDEEKNDETSDAVDDPEDECDEYSQSEEWAEVLTKIADKQFITTIRCGAHSAQLVVHDVCRSFTDELKAIRSTVKKLRQTKYNSFFEVSEDGRYPPLPNDTRWSSDHRMMKAIVKSKTFFAKLGTQFPEIDLSASFDFIEEYCEAFEPLADLTVCVQKLETTLSDFYLEWIKAYGRASLLPEANRFKSAIISSMNTRQQKMFSNGAVLACIFLDPRLTFNGSLLLNPPQKEAAIDYLMAIHKKLASREQNQETPQIVPKSTGFSVNDYLSSTIGNGTPVLEKNPVELQLRAIQYSPRVDADIPFNLISYWTEKSGDLPGVWPIVRVVLAIPATQCSIERDFNGFNHIFTKFRSSMAGTSVTSVLMVKTNPDLIEESVKSIV